MKYVIDKDNAEISIKDFLRLKKVSSTLVRRLKRITNGITVNNNHVNVLYI